MMKEEKMLNEVFWSSKYQSESTQWNAGEITQPLKVYIDQIKNKDISVLIPGVGHGHELRYLLDQGFINVCVIDIAKEPLDYIKKQLPDFPDERLIHGDFFDLKESFDLILEQTFFCALHPDLREKYAQKMNDLLAKNGKLVGVLFDFPLETIGLPPYGGSKKEYELLFSNYMRLIKIERCYNSIKPRIDRELFIHIEKKND